MSNAKSFDYIIVGAGSAGCTLANRLTEDPDVSVLVIEAGGSERNPLITIPLGWGKILFDRLFDWGYFTEPETEFDNRKVECARGKVIGGSSSINAMAYVRCHREDYDRWARNGCIGWSYADILPYFIRGEDWEKGDQPLRGTGGPLTTIENKYPDPLHEAWLEAGEAVGYPRTSDYNGEQNEGLGTLQSTIRDGRRCSAAVAYLRPAMQRPNLTVITKTLVHRVVLEGTRAVGVEYSSGGGAMTIVHADREVIISGGVINSPQLLMLSGLGNGDHLKEHGIDAVIDLKGVGQNLQDHLSVGVEYERIGDGPFVGTLRYDRLVLSMARAYFFGTGFATEMPGPLTGYITSRKGLAQPDMQLLARFIPPESQPWFPGFRPKPKDAFMVRPVVLHPKSRGELKLTSNSPADPALIYQNFLSEPADWETLRDGIEIVKNIASQKPLDKFRGPEIQPRDEPVNDFIKRTAWTVHHPLGTCKMGSDADSMAVVDTEMRVRGAENLRVIDASIFPDMLGGNINAPTIAFADRTADLMMGIDPLSPIEVTTTT
ncbi:MAG: GMC family oxidoreductase N-terminal domain-containing protein [Pseudomonadota bacterium]|nr:GMC family oxidoreductase N-terminal domain-containing protein [Pseudomonadota bacterium]